MRILDFSAGVPLAKDVKKAGFQGAIFYISPARSSWMKGKNIPKSVLDDFDKHGLNYAFVWQYGAGTPQSSDVMRGYNGGVADAKRANQKLQELGKSQHPVFFAVDFNITLDQWNSVAANYFRGAISVLGKNRVGIYGHSRVIAWAKEDGLVAELGNGKVLGWQTKAWSNGELAKDYCVLYQGTINVSRVVPHLDVDINDVWSDNWGQKPVTFKRQKRHVKKTSNNVSNVTLGNLKPNPGWRGDPTFLPEVLKAFGVKVQEYLGWRNRGHGDFGVIQGVVVHHTGTNKDIPGYIANHPSLGLCSQIHLNRDGTAVITGAGIAYHAGMGNKPGWLTNNANSNSIGIEAASDGVSAWPQKQLDAYYRCCAAILWYLGKDATDKTLIAHWEYSRHVQGKWDPGAGNGIRGNVMDMGNFRRQVQKYINAAKSGNVNGGNFLMSLSDKEQKELLKMTKYIYGQLKPWEQLGQNEKGQDLTPVDALAEVKLMTAYINRQLKPWVQLGQNEKGQDLTPVDALAATRQQLVVIEEKISEIEESLRGDDNED